MKEVWVKKITTKKGTSGYIVEIREKFFFSGEQMKKLAKGEIKGMKLFELPTEEKKKNENLPNVIKVSEEEMEF